MTNQKTHRLDQNHKLSARFELNSKKRKKNQYFMEKFASLGSKDVLFWPIALIMTINFSKNGNKLQCLIDIFIVFQFIIQFSSHFLLRDLTYAFFVNG